MNFFNWTPDLNLGIETIDEQHKRIADYINELHHAIEKNNKKQVIQVAQKVVEYTYEHFSYEENLLKKANYHLTQPHILVHHHFTKNAKQMKRDVLNSNDMTAAKKMRSELTVWLTNHIQKEDADYAQCVGHLFQKKSFFDGIFNFFSKK
jgi:hemerythrin